MRPLPFFASVAVVACLSLLPTVNPYAYTLPALPKTVDAPPPLPEIDPSYDTDGEDYCNGTLELTPTDTFCRPWMGKPMIAVPAL